MLSLNKNLLGLILFGVAFGFVEAAVVVYLRRIGYTPLVEGKTILNLGFISFQSSNLKVFSNTLISQVETWREAATILMLLSVAAISSKNFRQGIGALFIVFSVWDIFYYIFLRIIIGWPEGLLSRDIFFLIPVPWTGPVVTPLIISICLFVLGIVLFSKVEVKS